MSPSPLISKLDHSRPPQANVTCGESIPQPLVATAAGVDSPVETTPRVSEPVPQTSPERIVWIDVLKGMAILLVVLSHTAIPEIENEAVYLFHMPLFFWLSGLLYRPEKYPTLGQLVRKRSRSLLVPYFWFATVSYVVWFFVARYFGRDADEHLNPLVPIVGTLYSIGDKPWLVHNTPLWFLTCLFVVELLYWELRRWLPSTAALALGLLSCSIAGYWLSLHSPLRLPWGADVALSAVVFYGAGQFMRPWLGQHASSTSKQRVLTNLLASVLGILAMWWGFGFVNMSENILGRGYVSFYAAAFGGIVLCVVIAQMVPPNRLLTFFGRNTLIILALQIPCYGFVKAVQQYGFGFNVEETRDSLLWGIAQTGAIVGLLIPVIHVIDRWAPFLKGQRRTDLLTPEVITPRRAASEALATSETRESLPLSNG